MNYFMDATNGIPTDLGPYGVLVALFVLTAVGFTIAVKWLNAYVKQQTSDLVNRVTVLEGQVEKLRDGQGTAVALVTEVIANLPADMKDQTAKLVRACQALAVH